MPGGADDAEDEDHSVNGENRKRFKAAHKHIKEWKDSNTLKKRMNPPGLE